MKHLLLIRHAKEDRSDDSYPLSSVGEQQIFKLRESLIESLDLSRFIVYRSAALRAEQTANKLFSGFAVNMTVHDLLSESSTQSASHLMDTFFGDPIHNYVAAVGHNPLLDETVNTLLGSTRNSLLTGQAHYFTFDNDRSVTSCHRYPGKVDIIKPSARLHVRQSARSQRRTG